MKHMLSFVLCSSTILTGFAQAPEAQARQGASPSEQDEKKPRIVGFNPNESESFQYDGGSLRFIVSSEDTNGGWAILEVTEMPGYKTPIHRHSHIDEAFYVLEGVLTTKVSEETYEFPAGSYVLIPRGTPHAQGNFGEAPIKFLLTVTPGGFERFFEDRIQLFKTVKPDSPEHESRITEIRRRYIEIIGPWGTDK